MLAVAGQVKKNLKNQGVLVSSCVADSCSADASVRPVQGVSKKSIIHIVL